MGHEWKVGDWAEFCGKRYFVVKVTDNGVWSVGKDVYGDAISPDKRDPDLKHLPECTGWDWEPPKPIEPTARKWLFGDWAHSPLGIIRFIAYHGDMWFLCADGLVRPLEGRNAIYLPDCTGFDWTPPSPAKPPELEIPKGWFQKLANALKPIEPPPGYRIITDGIVSDGDMSLQDRGWYYSTAKGNDIAELLDLGAAKAYARKIEQPKAVPPAGYRLLGRDERVVDGDLCFDTPGMAADPNWRTASGKSIGCTAGFRMDNYGITAFARKIIGDTSDYIEPVYRPFANAAEFAPHRNKVVREEDEMLFFNLVLPPVSAADVVKRQVIVTIGTGESQTIDLVGTDLSTPELSGSDNDAVVGTLVDTDDAGNASPAREFSFVLVDTLAPPQPGELGIAITREE